METTSIKVDGQELHMVEMRVVEKLVDALIESQRGLQKLASDLHTHHALLKVMNADSQARARPKTRLEWIEMHDEVGFFAHPNGRTLYTVTRQWNSESTAIDLTVNGRFVSIHDSMQHAKEAAQQHFDGSRRGPRPDHDRVE